MNTIALLTLVAVGLAASWGLTALVRRYAMRTNLLDYPNGRSSHHVPTPRGGGAAIVASFMPLVLAMGLFGFIEQRLMVAALGAGALVALLGFLDDRSSLPARVRFAGHALAAAWCVGWMNGIPHVPIFGYTVDLGLAGPLLCGLFIVWTINLFNFMDGIDGIASVEAITTGLGGALLWWLAGSGSSWIAALVFASCVGGFLAWNFPSAKIFMGDAGSGFLGLILALLSLWSGQAAPALFWGWFVLIGCFMVDATTTLVRRVSRGEVFYEAHRSHAYQYAARKHGSHCWVTLSVGAINVFWLLPIAALVALRHVDGVIAVIVAYAPLVWLAFHYHAGDRRAQDV
jgi:Fuc2NAc and GlcNAc transferase